MKRIIEEWFADGQIQFVVQTNRLFGFIPCKWHTCTFYDAERDINFDAIFSTKEEALAFIGQSKSIVERKVIHLS